MSARRADLLESLATGWRRGGADILVAPVDVTDRAGVIASCSIRFDLEPSGIGVSVINPGFIRTPLTGQQAADCRCRLRA